jgi:methyl-accepting chemotaxis protein
VNTGKLKVTTKLWLFIVAIILSLAAVIFGGLQRSAAIIGDGRIASEQSGAMVRAATAWSALTETNLIRNRLLIQGADPAQTASIQADIETTSARISQLQQKIEQLAFGPEEHAQLQKIRSLRQAVLASRKAALQARQDGDPARASLMLQQDYLPLSASYLEAQRAFVALEERRQSQIAADTAQRHAANQLAAALVLALVAAAAMACTWRLVHSIRQPLAEANQLAGSIARGDLSAAFPRAQHTRADEFGQLAASLQHMNDGLAGMIRQVRASADDIAHSAAGIAQGNLALSARTESQASALQQSAASVEQLTATVRNNADHAQRASALALSASTLASQGGSAMQDAMQAMAAIKDSSQDIVDITSVEAARAGEQGRGFAVVASEVRTLAQRAAGAAREIKQRIGHSVEQIDAGNRAAGDACASIVATVHEMGQLAHMVAGIASASAEQSQGLQQINQAVAAMDGVTQQNAAQVEEAAAAAHAMQEQARQMAEMVRRFRLNGPEAAQPHRALLAPY